MQPRGEQRGFTLVEVLVALVAAAFLLAIVTDGALSARQREQAASARREAALLARDLAARASILPFEPGERRGTQGSFEWRVGESLAAADPRGRYLLAAVTVRVEDIGGKPLFDGETRALKTVPLR